MKKRALSLLMAVILVVSLLPTAVWAAETDISAFPEFTATSDTSTTKEFKISSANSLAALSGAVKEDNGNGTYNLKGITFHLANDIELTGTWTPISNVTYPDDAFAGTFDGNGHTISGLKTDGDGLFAAVCDATIKNLKVSGTVSGSTANVGGIVGKTQGTVTIKNCSFSGSVTSNKSSSSAGVGGIVGKVNNGTLIVENCANHAAVTATNGCPGGIIGYAGRNKISVSNCYNDGTISRKWYPSGICASNTYIKTPISTITNCYNAGTVSGGTNYAGISANFKGNSTGCYRTAPTADNLNSNSNNKGTSTLLTSDDLKSTLEGIGFKVTDDGKVSLPWEGGEAAEKHPHISISGNSTLYMTNSGDQPATTLTVTYTDMDSEPAVEWSTDSGIISLEAPENADTNNAAVIVKAVRPGTATVTATAGDYSAESTVSVVPYVTTVEITNKNQPGAVAVGQSVTAHVYIYGGEEYDYDSYPQLSYQWYKYDIYAGKTEAIKNATGKDYTVDSALFAGNDQAYKLGVEVKCGGKTVHSYNDHQAIVRSADHGKLYPVAYDPDLTLPSVIKADTQLTLPTSHTKDGMTATISDWTSSNPSVITNDGKVTCPDGPSVEVELKAKFTYSKNDDIYYYRTFKIAVWSKDESQRAQEQLNNAIDAAKLNTLYPTYGKDTNVLTMVEAKLNNSEISVAIKSVEKTNATDNSSNIADNGDVTFFYVNPDNAPAQRFGTYNVTFTFTRDGITAAREIPVVVYWDQRQVKHVMTAEILDKVTVDGEAAVTANFELPKVADGKKWTLISWQSSDPAITISTEKQATADTLFDPYVAVVRGGSAEKTVTLTATFTFQLANSSDETSALTLHKTFTVKVAPSDDGEKYQDALNAVFNDGSLKDITGDTITSANGVYSVSGDIQFPITGDLNRYMLDKYGEGHGFDGKYTPVLITSSDPDVIKAPDVANAARAEVYRPAPGQSAQTVTLTVRILDRPSGQGRDYASMPVLAEKTFEIKVQPLTQKEIDDELDLMCEVKAHYWDGIKNGNTYPQDVIGDLSPFVEVYKDKDGNLVWVRDVKDMTSSDIVPEAMDGWQELEAWRCFRSTNPTAVSHENLLVTRQFEGKAVTITSTLSSQTLGRYGQLYQSDKTKYAAYAGLADLYDQPVSADLVVRGYNQANMTEETVTGSDGKRKTIQVSTPKSETISVTFTLSGNGALWMDTTTLSDLPEGTTVYDVLQRLQKDGKLTFRHKGGYISSITFGDKTLTELEEGENSGWMYRVNGVLPDVYMSAYGLKNGDNIRVFFTTDYTKESGSHGGSTPSTVPTTPQQPTDLPFTDVQAGVWYADAVKYVFEQGLMSGISAQQFGPDSTVTRGQVVTILWRLAGSPTVSGKTFTDVSASVWYADAVAWASANGVVSGYESGLFGPEDQVTREQLAAILYRYALISGKDTEKTADLSGYTDSVTISTWAPQAVKWAVGSGLISGTGATTLSPRGTATRAQIAVILQNYCK